MKTIEHDPKKANYQVERHLSVKEARKKRVKDHNEVEDAIRELNEIYRPNYTYNPNYIAEDEIKIPDVEGIYLGKEWKTEQNLGLKIKRLAADVLIDGPSDSGKTVALHNIIIYGAFQKSSNMCKVYFDFKGEAHESLTYLKDGKTFSFLQKKIIHITEYKSNVYENLGPDRIIIINLAMVKKDPVKFRTTIRDVLREVKKKIDEFNDLFVRTRQKPDFKIQLTYEEAYTIFPKHHHTNDTWKAFQSKARNLYIEQKRLSDKAEYFMKQGDHNSAEYWNNEASKIPNLYDIQNEIEDIANENAKSNRHLGVGATYSTQRLGDLNPNLASQCNTTIILGANIKSDEDVFKTENVDKELLSQFLGIPRSSSIRFMLVTTKDFRAIIKKPEIILFHKSKNVKEEKRKEQIVGALE